MAVLLTILIFLLSWESAVMNSSPVVDDCTLPTTSEEDDLVDNLKTVMVSAIDSLKPIATKAMDRVKTLDVLGHGAKLDMLFQQEEEHYKRIMEHLDNMSKQVQEIREQQSRDLSHFESKVLFLTDSTKAVLNDVIENTARFHQESHKNMQNSFLLTKDHISSIGNNLWNHLEIAKSDILEVNKKLLEMEQEERKAHDKFAGMIEYVQEKIENNVSSKIDDVLKQLSHVSISIASVKSSSDENQKQLSATVTSVANDVKELATELGKLGKEVVNTKSGLQEAKAKISEIIKTVFTNITTMVKEVQSEVVVTINQTASSQHLNSSTHDIKALIEEKCDLSLLSAPGNCAEIQKSGQNINGIYTIRVGSVRFQVYCDFKTDGGGWTVFQRRNDITPHTDFFRYWADYKAGFGDLNKEFWLGLDAIRLLTSRENMSLRVDLEDFEGNKRFALYERFSVGEVKEKYRLSVEGYKGDAGDSLKGHNGYAFTTRDVDNDVQEKLNCGQSTKSGWWFNYCLFCNLNGEYMRAEHSSRAHGIIWSHWKGFLYSLKGTEMKMRPHGF